MENCLHSLLQDGWYLLLPRAALEDVMVRGARFLDSGSYWFKVDEDSVLGLLKLAPLDASKRPQRLHTDFFSVNLMMSLYRDTRKSPPLCSCYPTTS